MASKRLSFRYACDQYPMTYKTAHVDGEGTLQDISTGGCAFTNATQPLNLDEKILISITLADSGTIFEAQGRVIRLKNDIVAVKYVLIEPESERMIREYFSRKRHDAKS